MLRHGQSNPNVAGIILSHPEDGRNPRYTLTPKGEADVLTSAQKARDEGLLDTDTLIVSSPFSRCVRTAEIVREAVGIEAEILLDDRLRERWFGDWEKTSNKNYQKVWDADRVNPAHILAGVESANDVQNRVLAFIKDLEERYVGKTILLVSHGDALQILQTGIEERSAAEHRDVPHLETAEIRKLATG